MPHWAQRLLYIVGTLILLWLVVYIAFRTPAVQDYLTGIVEKKASEQLHTTVSLGGIDIDFLDEIILEELYIEDQRGDTLLYTGKFRVAFDVWPALSKTISIRMVEVRDTYANLYQLPNSDSLNFEFIPAAFASDTTTQPTPKDTTSSSWDIQAGELFLGNIRFDYRADSTMMQMKLRQFQLLFDKISLDKEQIGVDEIHIDGLAFDMQLPAVSTDTSQTTESDTTDSNVINPSGYTFEVGLLTLGNSSIGYRVGQATSRDSLDQTINFENLALTHLETQVEDVFVGEKKIDLALPKLAFTENNSGFRLKEFAVTAAVDMPSVQATLSGLQTAYSHLEGAIDFEMQISESTATLINSVRLQSDLDGTVLGMQDVGFFSNALEAYPGITQLEAELSWQLNLENGQGNLNNMSLALADRASLQAQAEFSDLAALDSAVGGSPYFNFQLDALNTDYTFLSSLLDDSTAQYLQRIPSKSLSLTAQVQGQLNDLQANLNLQTGIGQLLASGQYQDRGSSASVTAELQARQFDTQTMMLALGNPDSVARDYGNLNLKAELSAIPVFGQDTSLQRAQAKLLVQDFTFKEHTYQNLSLDAQMMQDSVHALLSYEDSLLQVRTEAGALLKGQDSQYTLDMRLQNANLYRLGLIQDSIIVSDTRLVADASGNSMDNIVGELKVNDARIIKGSEAYELDSLILLAEKTDFSRTFALTSNHMDISLNGKFSIEALPQAFDNFQQYYLSAYEAPFGPTDTVRTFGTQQELFLDLNIREAPLIARAFLPSLNIAEPVRSSAYFNSERKKLTFRFYAPNVLYQDYHVDSLLIRAQTSQRAIMLDTKSDFIRVGGLTLPELSLKGNLSGVSKDELDDKRQRLFATQADLNLKIGADDAPYRLDLNTVLSGQQDTILIKLDSSALVLDERAWQFSENTRLAYASNYLKIDNFLLRQNDQVIRIATDNQGQSINLRVLIDRLATGPLLASFDLEDYQIGGKLNAEVSFEDLFNAGNLDASLGIDTLQMRAMPVGKLSVNASGQGLAAPETNDPLLLKMNLDGENNQLNVDGSYRLDSGYFDIGIDMESFQLSPWQAFTQEFLEQIEGELTASLRLRGTPDDPELSGSFTFADEVTLVPTSTGAVYYINNEQIDFEGKSLVFDSFVIEDSARTQATLDGTVRFDDLTNPGFDLDFETDHFLFVNNESFENDSFYGKAYASASIKVGNTLNDLQVTGDVSLNEDTDFYISLVDDAASASRADYVSFVEENDFQAKDTLSADSIIAYQEAQFTDSAEVNGLTINTDVQVNQDARITIVLDPVNGDQITARGDADLNVSMNPTGDVNIQGAYVIESGEYVLTFAQLIQKEFQIREGSSIVFSGDPTNARFDIAAIYTAQTTLENLIPSTYRSEITETDYITTEQPVNVVMQIRGDLDDPVLSFNIEVPEMTSQGLDAMLVQEIISNLENEQTSMYKQVFGLIVLNRFIPQGGGFGSSSSGGYTAVVNERIDNSVSRLLSSTLSELTQQYLGGVQINMDLESNQLQAQNTALADRELDVSLSKAFFDDRLKVSLGGMTTLNTNSNAAQGMANAASDNDIYGEFDILYRLDTKGNLNIRIFQENERNIFDNNVRQIRGVSLSYQRSFDEIFADESNVIQNRPMPEDKKDEQQDKNKKDSTALDNAQRRTRQAKSP